ncbi:dual specificity protein phosphatase family protein [Rhynchospora pubera]|uniref:phosphatidylglycerophosphatase n=1 Tax=Rhynchospora pubera TaxID=906938 RepID=A0AAV8G5D6_9POAL|nr:dual specificity protein phosphatase family protein [Rhynchospora pubera]KAJ4798123.1 dual specificity protein phosphatase family protein [Rhynchospora pubera]
MKIVELGEDGSEIESSGKEMVPVRAKKVLVLAGARLLFYPTLFYNVVRNKMQAEFRWWDEVDQYILLGAVPFPSDVPRLRMLGVRGVVTLNEPYETLVPSELYQANEMEHLVLPTRDYLFAPSLGNICRAVDFIYRNAITGKKTYVHCKAGRGRSTTVVLCYLVKYKNMTPEEAFEHVRSIRPRVLLARSQWKAVQDFSRQIKLPSQAVDFFSDDAVLVTKEDLEGYCAASGSSYEDLSIISSSDKVSHIRRPIIAMLACLFTSFRVSGTGSHLVRDPLPEVPAC